MSEQDIRAFNREGFDSGIKFINDEDGSLEYVAFEPEQIHILGSKQDIEGFKEFVNQTKKPELSELEIQEFKEKFPNFANLQPFEKKAIEDNEDLDIQCKL